MVDALELPEESEERCDYEKSLYVRCIRPKNHAAEHFFILPECAFDLKGNYK